MVGIRVIVALKIKELIIRVWSSSKVGKLVEKNSGVGTHISVGSNVVLSWLMWLNGLLVHVGNYVVLSFLGMIYFDLDKHNLWYPYSLMN